MVNDVRTELFYDDQWNAITTDVRQDPPITIKWGRKNEAAKVSPSSLTLTLENADGTYSPRHPLSPLYGKLTRNTPIRVRLGDTKAAVALPGRRTAYVSTPDSASLDVTGDLDIRIEIEPETWRAADGIELARKYGVTGDQRSWAWWVESDGDMWVRWSPDGTFSSAVSVGSTDPVPDGSGQLALRWTLDVDDGAGNSVVTFYTAPSLAGPWTQLGSTTVIAGTTSVYASTIGIELGRLNKPDGNGIGGLDPLTGRLIGFELYDGINGTAVASPDFGAENPGDTTFADPTVTDAQGNVWTLEGYTSITDTSVRFTGEVASWPPEWDLSGADVRVPVEAAGIRRRLGQGEKPINSSLFRDLSNKDNVPYYVPLEGGTGTTIFSATTGGGPLRIFGDVSPGAYSDLAASDAIPTFNVGSIRGSVDAYAPDPDQRLMAVISVPGDGVAADAHLLECLTNGSARQWIVSIDTNGNLRLQIWDDDDASLHDSGFIAFDLNGLTGLLWLSFEPSGSDIDWSFGFLEVGSDVGHTWTGTLTGHDYDRVTWLRLGTYTNDLNGMAIGHLALLNGDIHGSFWDTASSSLRAWSGETAGDRIVRLCDEESIPLRVVGAMSDSAAMGPQRIDTLLGLLDECAAVDMGLLTDDRDAVRLLYRARSDLYNQDVALTLDYATGDVAARLKPVEDDQLIRNDVTVKRPNGGSHQAVLATGPMSVTKVGRYDTEPEVNVASDNQLADQAAWRLHLGTVDEPRYPTISVDLTATPSKATDATGVHPGDRVQITNPPSWEPPGTIDQLAQGGTETLTPHRHTIAFNCSPASPWDVAVVGETKADTAGSELDTSITDTATSMDVRTTMGEDWTTDAAEVPFDVELGGEVVTVTTIGAAVGGVQTFTITRGVNGITKAHAAGTSVRLATKHRAVVRL